MGVFDSWTFNLANLRAAGVVSAKIRKPSDDAYYSVGIPRDAKITVKPLSKPDTKLRPYTWAHMVEITWQSIDAGYNIVHQLDKLITNAPFDFKIGLTDGLYFNPIASSTPMGLKWKIISGGDADDFRIIEYTIAGVIKESEIATVITSSPAADGSPNPSDALYFLNSIDFSSTYLMPNGLTTLYFKAADDGSYANTDFQEGKFTFETIGEDGGGGRKNPRTTAIKFTFDAKVLQTSETEIDLVQAIALNQIDLQLIAFDGVAILLSHDVFQLTCEVDSEGNADKIRSLAFHGEGVITDFTSWNGVWSD